MQLPTVVRPFAFVLFAAAACGCRGCTSPQGESSAEPRPVEECQQYEATLNACHHRNLSIANQPTLLAKSDEDRARIKKICADNLQRIRAACGLFGPVAASSAKPR